MQSNAHIANKKYEYRVTFSYYHIITIYFGNVPSQVKKKYFKYTGVPLKYNLI